MYNIKMMKKKLFYLTCSLFLFLGGYSAYAQENLKQEEEIDYDELQYLSDEKDEPIQNEKTQAFWEKIEDEAWLNEEENRASRVSLEEYQQENTDKIAPKSDTHWDLAWHARLADFGDSESQFVIAKAYEEGNGVAVNPQKAVAFYKMAAENNHIEASMALARIYSENKWLESDFDKSVYYYQKASDQDYVPAQIKISQLYEEKQMYDKAYEYMQKASQNMFPDAKDLENYSLDLKRLGDKIKQQEKEEQERIRQEELKQKQAQLQQEIQRQKEEELRQEAIRHHQEELKRIQQEKLNKIEQIKNGTLSVEKMPSGIIKVEPK